MIYTRLKIKDIVLCEPTFHNDDRGMVFESYKYETFNDFIGYKINFCQDNCLYSNQGVIRGLHTNTENFAQSKLVSVVKGEILDVVVDFRVGSPTFGQSISISLSDKNKKQLFIPKGFLHGFSCLSSYSIVMIKVDNYFAPGESIGVKYNDEFLDIDWMIDKNKIILSSNDLNLQEFNEVVSPFNYKINYYEA